jgi:hypothetical protein
VTLVDSAEQIVDARYIDAGGILWGFDSSGNVVPSASASYAFKTTDCSGAQFVLLEYTNPQSPTRANPNLDESKQTFGVLEVTSSGTSVDHGTAVPQVRAHVVVNYASQWVLPASGPVTCLSFTGPPPYQTGWSFYGWELSEVQSIATKPAAQLHPPFHYEMR